MMRFLPFAVLAMALPASPAQFDAASIHKSAPEGGGKGMRLNPIKVSPVTLTMQNVTLKDCIRWAWNVGEYQVTGPDWIGFDRYDIAAKSANPATEDEMRAMMQALLGDRFGLEFHRQTKVFSSWLLEVGKDGPKFKESETEGDLDLQPDMKKMSIVIRRAPISQLVEMVTRILQAPVVDMTGLKGRYDITVDLTKYIPQLGDGQPDLVGLLMNGLQNELGLRLESKKAPLDLLVVDHAERIPGEN